MKTKKLLAMLLVVAMSVALLAGCGDNSNNAGSDVSTPVSNAPVVEGMVDSVVVAVDDDSFTVAPWGGDSSVRDLTQHLLYATLAYSPFIGATLASNELELVAAKSVTKVDDLTYRVEIYDNITDSKGNHITAEDVIFSFDTLYSLSYVSYINTYYAGGKVLGDYELELYLTTSDEGGIEGLLTNCTIASKAWYENASEDERLSSPACTGTYYVTDVQTAHSVSMEAREDYWKTENRTSIEAQTVKAIQLLCITEADARAIALQNNEVDMAEIATLAVPEFAADTKNYVVSRYSNAMNDYMVFNTSEYSVCSDINVRKAIAYAFDSAGMFMLGYGNSDFEVHYDVCSDLTPDFQEEWKTQDYYSQNIEKAKEYLAAAGYGAGELHVRLLCVSQAPQGPYQVLQQMLNEVGIVLEIDPYDRAVFQNYSADPTQWDLTISAASVVDFTTTYWSRLFSELQFGPERGTEGFTVDPKLQELLRAACADRSPENLNAFHDYVVEQCYMLGLYNETKSIVSKTGLVDLHIVNGNPTLNAMTYTTDYASVGLR